MLLVIPFGVTSALAQFMDMMNGLLHDFVDQFILVLLDDIMIYSANIEEHAKDFGIICYMQRDSSVNRSSSQWNFSGNRSLEAVWLLPRKSWKERMIGKR